jgi:hypothetical protein
MPVSNCFVPFLGVVVSQDSFFRLNVGRYVLQHVGSVTKLPGIALGDLNSCVSGLYILN